MNDAPPPVSIDPARRSFFERASFVWVIPIIALAIALGVAWQTYDNRGPLIEIEFANGSGISERETELRYRDVTVGVVEEVKFAPGLAGVVVSVRLEKEIARYIDSQASFWVVRPELSARGVSGLDTVLTGVYIEGNWDSAIGETEDTFTGLTSTPLLRTGEEGLQITLRTIPGGTLTDDSPITFRGIEVGRVGKAQISQQGNFAIAEAIIYEPHTRLISPSTRFWDTSGFTFSVGPGGAEIDFSSFATLVGGGLTFDTFVSGGGDVLDGTQFEVYGDEATARNSVFNASEVETLEMRVIFEENISGLAVDAAVELSGLKIGKVQSVSGIIDPDTFGDSRVRLNAVLSIQPARLGLQDETTADAALTFLTERIAEGLRARLASASLLVGGLKVELVQVEGLPTTEVQTGEGIIPIIPTTRSEITDAAATVEGVISRINNLPIEELLNSAIELLDSAESLISNEDLQSAPQDLRALLGDISGIVSSDDTQNIPIALNATIQRFESILSELESVQLATKLTSAVEAASLAASGVAASVEGVPDLVTQLEAVAANAATVPLTDLANQLTELLAAADQILGTEAARNLPADLSAALQEVNATLAELREGGAVTNINDALASTSKAADAVATSVEDLPALIDRTRTVLDEANRTIASYNQGEVLSRDAQTALRDISKAADAVASLARLLERNPRALIRGR